SSLWHKILLSILYIRWLDAFVEKSGEISIFRHIFPQIPQKHPLEIRVPAGFSSPKSTFKRVKRSSGAGVGILHSIGSINRGLVFFHLVVLMVLSKQGTLTFSY
ncbi:hypothetical protein ACFLUO_07385, partial [Chloroflexota bacterium]